MTEQRTTIRVRRAESLAAMTALLIVLALLAFHVVKVRSHHLQTFKGLTTSMDSHPN